LSAWRRASRQGKKGTVYWRGKIQKKGEPKNANMIICRIKPNRAGKGGSFESEEGMSKYPEGGRGGISIPILVGGTQEICMREKGGGGKPDIAPRRDYHTREDLTRRDIIFQTEGDSENMGKGKGHEPPLKGEKRRSSWASWTRGEAASQPSSIWRGFFEAKPSLFKMGEGGGGLNFLSQMRNLLIFLMSKSINKDPFHQSKEKRN